MIWLYEEVERLIQLGGQEFVDQVVTTEKGFAPHSSGKLRASIHAEQIGKFRWLVTTNALGENGFAYPARIEAGQEVVPTKKKALHFKVHGKEIYTKRARASYQSHFARNTVDTYR